ncbi:MAG: DEAD/DEAH box helicase family protein [Rhabdochlamydiaceae bacterium]|nr:DEAD/DEAH box helicase family protein [Rhabdochlamydiaceae bacterium]
MSTTHLSSEWLDLIFSQTGLLGRFLGAYEERSSQKEMAEQILIAYAKEKTALIEAGTGIGKSLAYLVPAVYWALKHQEKTVISTHTIALQEQLIHKDIPFLLRVMDADLKAVLVKGMGNYLCLRKLAELQSQPLLFSTEESNEVQAIERWVERSKEGSRSEIVFPLSPGTWEKVAAESDTCNHVHCPHYKECFFFRARKMAEDAQILVINHHLLMADINARRQADFREEKAILPSFERAVIDEAHHLEEIALESFAASSDRLYLNRLLAKVFSETHPERSRLFLIRKEFTTLSPELQHQLDVAIPVQKKECAALVENAFSLFTHFIETQLQENVPLGREWKKRITPEMTAHAYWSDPLMTAFKLLADHLLGITQSLLALDAALETFKGTKFQEALSQHSIEIRALALRFEQQAQMLLQFFSEKTEEQRVRWVEIHPSNVLLVEATLDVSSLLQEHFFSRMRTAALCSATLTTNRGFSFVKERLGLKGTLSEQIYDSPFDYENRSLLLVPTDFPAPTDPQFNAQAISAIASAIEASRGNTFVLFTSYEMLQQCYDKLSLTSLAQKYPLLRQGQLSRRILLEQFKETEGSVLFATSSFWEGVDVPGDALRCVIIVKLPFQVPTEPLIQACTERMEREGKNPFNDYSVPQAVIKFKQGFGRLIRTKNDRGCIVCLDNRIIKKGYGKVFINSLPPCKTSFVPQDKAWEEMRALYSRTDA